MSRRSNYTAKFKTKIVLEVLKEEKELGVIAAENNLNPNMVRKWRKEFLENAESVFENPTQIEKDFQRKEDDLKKKMAPKVAQAPKPKPASTPSTPSPSAVSPSTSPQPTASAQPSDQMIGKPCPLCGKGHLIKGNTAYGCSRWKEGCSYRLPFK